MVFQGSALFDSMTVEENVMFPLKMSKTMGFREMQERVNFCLNRVDLKNVNSLHSSELSGGMQKRVAIARAIALHPKYLFCDEPNSGLDPTTAAMPSPKVSSVFLKKDLNPCNCIFEIYINNKNIYPGGQ